MESTFPSGQPSVVLSPLEEVFSNKLLVSLIWKYFDTQDLFRTSLVSTSWCAKAREFLKIGYKNHPFCIQISHESPCRQLGKFNKFLEETHITRSNDPIIFNGIQCRPISGKVAFSKCENCLAEEWKTIENLPGISNEMLEEIIQKTMLIIYGRILEKIKFKFIRIQYDYPFTCPVAKFVKFVLENRPDDVVELDLKRLVKIDGPRPYEYDYVSYFENESRATNVTKIFQNLEVLGLPDGMYNGNRVNADGVSIMALPIVAPLLKTINHFQFYHMQAHDSIFENFPLHAISTVFTWLSPDWVQGTLNFIAEFRPKVKNILIGVDDCSAEEAEEVLSYSRRCAIFELGRLISTTLTSLTCHFPTLTFISSVYSENGEITRNSFPSLQCLKLIGRLGVDFIDWSNGTNFSMYFPKLTKVEIAYDVQEICVETDCVVSGPFNRAANVQWRNALHLIVRPQEKMQFLERHPVVLRTLLSVFAHVRHLDLRKLRLTCNAQDKIFGELMSELGGLLFLEEITVKLPVPAMRVLSLDHLFLENITAIREKMARMLLGDMLLYKTSVLDHKTLKQINITGSNFCTESMRNYGDIMCISSQQPGIFLVTSRAAGLIGKYRPGFKFHVNVEDGRHLSNCRSEHRRFRLEHLETQAEISSDLISNKRFSVTVEF